MANSKQLLLLLTGLSVALISPHVSAITESDFITADDDSNRIYWGSVRSSGSQYGTYTERGVGWCWKTGASFIGCDWEDYSEPECGYSACDRYRFRSGDGDDTITFASGSYVYMGTWSSIHWRVYPTFAAGDYSDFTSFFWGDEGDDIIYCCENINCNYSWNNCIADGRDGDDYVIGTEEVDYLYGGTGEDHIYGNDGNDYMEGWTDNDTMYGYEGNDTIYGQSGSDLLRGGDDQDCLKGGDGNDSLLGDGGTCNELHGENHFIIGSGDYCQCGSSQMPSASTCESESNCTTGSCSICL